MTQAKAEDRVWSVCKLRVHCDLRGARHGQQFYQPVNAGPALRRGVPWMVPKTKHRSGELDDTGGSTPTACWER